jgi:hypothetical protein
VPEEVQLSDEFRTLLVHVLTVGHLPIS